MILLPDGDGSVTDFEVLKFEGFTLNPFPYKSRFGRERKASESLPHRHRTECGEGQEEQSQSALQHHFLFGILTLLPDRKSVKPAYLFRTLLLTHPPHTLSLTFHGSPLLPHPLRLTSPNPLHPLKFDTRQGRLLRSAPISAYSLQADHQ